LFVYILTSFCLFQYLSYVYICLRMSYTYLLN